MAPLTGGESAYDNVIDYVGMTTACAPQATDSRDPALDASSLATTVTSWSFRGPIDFIADEGAPQPPDADQGMGEGHMLYIFFNAIRSAKTWVDNEGAHHVDSFDKTPALVQAAAQRVIGTLE